MPPPIKHNLAPALAFEPRSQLAEMPTGALRSPDRVQKRVKKPGSACEPCRSKRAKCDGAKPICTTCASIERDCTYGPTALVRQRNEVQQRLDDLEKLYQYLKERPESEAQRILRLIRTEGDISNVVNHIDAGELLLRISFLSETPV